MQSGKLQLHSYSAVDNIVFGYGKSSAMTERMTIINNGDIGLDLNGRIILKNGTNPVNPAYGAGIWMYKGDNSGLLGFMGVQDNKNMGFYGGPAGWGFTYDAINSRVGIGNNNPNAPLSFPPVLGKKITLYPGATGDVGFAVAGNRLQIYSDHSNADVAIGYDLSGAFIERFAVKPNGALAVSGNTGAAGQVLQSNGSGSTATWAYGTSAMYSSTNQLNQPGNAITIPASTGDVVIPGLGTGDFSINLPAGSNKVILSFKTYLGSTFCTFCNTSYASFNIRLFKNGLLQGNFIANAQIVNGTNTTYNSGIDIINGTAGTYTVSVSVTNSNTHDITVFASRLFFMALGQ